jgi:hypothetical protein
MAPAALVRLKPDILTLRQYLFGVKRTHTGTWLAWTEVQRIAEALDLPTVPLLFRGVLGSMGRLEALIAQLLARQPASCAGAASAEGFVLRVARAFDAPQFGSCVAK